MGAVYSCLPHSQIRVGVSINPVADHLPESRTKYYGDTEPGVILDEHRHDERANSVFESVDTGTARVVEYFGQHWDTDVHHVRERKI